MPVNYLFMSAKENKLSLSRLEQALENAKIDKKAFKNRFNLYKQKRVKWKERGVPNNQLVEIAKYIGVSVEQLVGYPPADHIKHELREVSPAYRGNAGREVPLISWVRAGNWCEASDPFEPGDADEWLPCPAPCGPNTYALKVQGISMEPEFKDGDIIWVDPDETPRHKSCVIVRLDDSGEATFKQLIIEGDKRLLQALNPDWPTKIIPVNEKATFCGVVICKMHRYT